MSDKPLAERMRDMLRPPEIYSVSEWRRLFHEALLIVEAWEKLEHDQEECWKILEAKLDESLCQCQRSVVRIVKQPRAIVNGKCIDCGRRVAVKGDGDD